MTITNEQPEQWAVELASQVIPAWWRDNASIDYESPAAALLVQRAFAEREAELVGAEEEAHKIGVEDGRTEMVREIDLATGGDGEFFASTIPGRGCEDADAMKDRVLGRFTKLREALSSAIGALEDSSGLDEAICCSGHDCGCRGSTHRQLLLHDLSTALKSREAGHG